jgi:tripartite-type tricarboxylate transporter receptor subunit TctC
VTRPIAALLASLLTALGICTTAQAQNYPTRPIRLIVPFPPGGGTDITARAVAVRLTESLGQTVVVDNRAGANGTIGMDITAKSTPDGYTIAMVTSNHAVNAGLTSKLPYDLVKDLTAVTQATSQPYTVVINPSVPAKNIKEFIAYAKAKPGGVNYASSGTGSIAHLGAAWIGHFGGIQMVHIPYKGGAPATLDLIAGRCQMMLGSLLLTMPHVKSGKLRILAITTPKRWHGTPDLPTMQESGVPGYAITQWYGMLAPAKTSPAIVNRLSKEISRLLNTPEVKERLAADGADAVGNTPAEFGALVKSEIEKYTKIIKQIGLKPE